MPKDRSAAAAAPIADVCDSYAVGLETNARFVAAVDRVGAHKNLVEMHRAIASVLRRAAIRLRELEAPGKEAGHGD